MYLYIDSSLKIKLFLFSSLTIYIDVWLGSKHTSGMYLSFSGS